MLRIRTNTIFFPSWLATKLNRRKGSQRERDTGPVKPSKLTKFLVSLPCCGISKLILTGICIIVTVVISTQNKDEQEPDARLDCLVFVTIYISFALSGLVDIFIFYSSTSSLLPKQCDGLILTLCFLIETLLVYFTEQDHCLLSIIVCCLVVSVLKMVHTTTILTFSLVIFTMVQGTWLLHSSFLPTSHSMTNIYFSWHLLAVFIITTTLNIISNISVKRNSQKRKLSEEAQQKTSNLTDTVKKTILTFDELNVDILQKEKLNLVTEQPKSREDLEIMNVLNSIDKMVSNQGRAENCKDNEENPLKERISPLEEFNALFRNVEGVRKSIKLKDSGIV